MRKLLIVCLVVSFLPCTAAADHLDNVISLLRVPVFKVRAQAALALGGQKGEAAKRVVGPLTRALKDPHRAVRAAAAIALGKLSAIEAASALSDAMSDADRVVARMSRKSLDRVLQAFVRNRGRFEERRFNFYVAGLRAENRFKDLVIERLLQHDNVEVGVDADFSNKKAEPPPMVDLEIRGEMTDIDGKRAHLKLTLALRKGGYVLTSWKRVVAIGKTRDDLLANAAQLAVGRVLGYLGAGRR